jgi:hypothetical protein
MFLIKFLQITAMVYLILVMALVYYITKDER